MFSIVSCTKHIIIDSDEKVSKVIVPAMQKRKIETKKGSIQKKESLAAVNVQVPEDVQASAVKK